MKSKFFVALLTVLGVGLLIILSYEENGVTTYHLYKTSSIREFSLVHKEHEEGSRISWELTAENATFPDGNKEIILEYLKMVIHHEHEFVLTGGSGIYKIQEKSLTIYKPVEIDVEGAKLTTDSLTWNGVEGVITTKDRVRFKGKKFLIEGKGLSAEIEDQKIRILKDVKGVFYR